MRRLLVSTLAVASLTLGAAGALAQSRNFPAPVPNASGSQVTAPQTYRATAYQNRPRHVVNMKMKRKDVRATGSIRRSARAIPVPNASGSQVTSPETYRATAYQNRR